MVDIDFLSKSWQSQVLGAKADRRLALEMVKAHANCSRRQGNLLSESVVCFVTDGDRRVSDVGVNCPGDLMLDNFGKILAGFFTYQRATARSVQLARSDTGALYGVNIWWTSYSSMTLGGTYIKIGDGNAAPTRSDWNLTSPLASPVGDAYYPSDGVYCGGVVASMVSIACAFSGVCREVGLFYDPQAYSYDFMLFHDLLQQSVSFSAGQAVHVVYGVNL